MSEDVGDIWAGNNPEIALIAQRYERSDLHAWNNSRVAALAKALNKTIWVLCAEAGAFTVDYSERQERMKLTFDRRLVKQCWRFNRWPPFLALHFDRLESCIKKRQNFPNQGAPFVGAADIVSAKLLSGTL